MMTFEIAICAAVKAFSASACSDSAALTISASPFARSSSAGRSSADAAPTFLLAAFCSARRLSAAETAARRAASASNSASTSPGSSPRARCDARTTSGFSRSSLRSITAQPYRREHNPITLQPPHLSQCPARLSQWSGCWTYPSGPYLLADEADHPTPKVTWWRSLHATSTRRALLLTALGGLLIAGVLTALPRGEGGNGLQANAISLGLRGAETFGKAKSGDCLNWPERTPDEAEVVDCKDEHRFEVAESVDMRTFPGSEYGPDAAPPSPARIQQISQEQCQVAVRRYLGERFDPNSRYTVSMMWSGDKAWRQSGERRMLCGLQLPGPNNTQLAFQGKVADIDQSKVWPAGTCLGIDPSTNQPTDIPVDCAGPHAMEVTGAVNVAEKFPAGLPPEPEQDAFIKDACTRMTDAYLAPIQLRSTTLTLIYSTISLPSWAAGSHQVSCSIGATLGNGGWSTLLNSAKGPLQINGQPPIPPPDYP